MPYIFKAYRNVTVLRDGRIDCEVDHPKWGWIPFTADPNDCEIDGRELFAELNALPNEAKTFQGPKTTEELAAEVRMERNIRLATEVDPFVSNPLRWMDLTQEQQLAYATYRRALLDIPEQPGFPHTVNWPILAVA